MEENKMNEQPEEKKVEEKEIWIDKSETERIRVARSEFKGKDLVDVRTYFEASDGEWRPTKKGINISYEKLQEVKKALNDI